MKLLLIALLLTGCTYVVPTYQIRLAEAHCKEKGGLTMIKICFGPCSDSFRCGNGNRYWLQDLPKGK